MKRKDLNKRLAYKRFEKQKLIKRILNNQAILENDYGIDSSKGSITVIRNGCLLTGRKRGLVKKYKISRIKIKELFKNKQIPGLRKST